MKRWLVTLPLAGSVTVEVDAENEAAAIDEAFDVANFTVHTFGTTEVECETMRTLVRGNVSYAPVTNASAELIEDDEGGE